MRFNADTYETVDQAIEIISDAALQTGCIGHRRVERAWDALVAMRDDVSPEVFERGIRAHRDSDRYVKSITEETQRRAMLSVARLLG